MRSVYYLMTGGALFRKKLKEPEAEVQESRAREAAIRKKVVDDLRGREDALRNKEAELASREEDLNKKSAELALKLQELAGRESELGARHVDAGAAAARTVPAELHSAPDADTLEGQEKLIKALEQRLETGHARLDEMRKKSGIQRSLGNVIQAFRSAGYSVSRLEALKGVGPDDIQKAIERYERDVASLRALANRCDAVDRVLEKEANALRALCKDPDAVAAVEKGLAELESRVGARRKELINRVDGWRADGYTVDRFGALRDGGLGALEEAVLKFEEDLEVLRMFAEKIDGMDEPLRRDADRLRPLLKNPDRLHDLERELLAIEKKIGVQRQEFMELLEGWKSEGFRTEPLDKVLAADMGTLRTAFLRFDEDIRRLRSLAERASKLEAGFPSQVAALGRSLKDPEQISRAEAAIIALEDEQQRKRTGAAAFGPAAAAPSKAPGAHAVPAAATTAAATPGRATAARPAPSADRASAAAPAHTAPAPEKARGVHPAPAAHPAAASPPAAAAAPPASAPDADVQAQIQAAENLIKGLEAKGVEATAASNLLRLAKSFARSKNSAKALQYAQKANETAASIKK